MYLDGKVSGRVDVVSGVPQVSVLWLLLYILYTSEFFRIVGNHIVGYANHTTIYAVVPRRIFKRWNP